MAFSTPVTSRILLLVAILCTAACSAGIPDLGDSVEPRDDAATTDDVPDLDTRVSDTITVESNDAPTPDVIEVPSLTDSGIEAGFDATPTDVPATEPGIVRCGATATRCDTRDGHLCCALVEGRRCVAPGEPVPGDVCPQPAQCDDDADCHRPGFGTMTHCCRRSGGGSDCRGACLSGEDDLP